VKLVDTYRGAVYPWHCDHMGHMNVMWYVGKFDEATWQFFTLLGLTPEFLRERGRGMAAVEQRIAYQRELVAGDVVTVRTGVLEVRDRAVRFVHEMRNAASGDVAAVTALAAVHLDTAERRATALPQGVKQRARRLITDFALPWDGERVSK
jgi:acyl-CoA thioester hydrolase